MLKKLYYELTMATVGKDRYSMLFWVLIGCTIITVIVTMFMMYRMSQKPDAPASNSKIASGPPASASASASASTTDSVQSAEKFVSPTTRNMVYIYSTSCGWCERFNPVWTDFVDRYAGPLTVLKVEARQPEAKQYEVKGYPTVMVVENGQRVALFNEERTVENLLKFARANEAST
jgi:thioredoxin-like negative regulator of GroEL